MIAHLITGMAVPTSYASLPPVEASRNGLIRTGNSLLLVVDEKDKNSALSQCLSERGSHLFSHGCNDLVVSLRKKMSMMALESDLQIQNEKLNNQPAPQSGSERLAWLEKINLLSVQAEDTIRAAQNATPGAEFKGDITEILNSVSKVKASYLAYLKLFEK